MLLKIARSGVTYVSVASKLSEVTRSNAYKPLNWDLQDLGNIFQCTGFLLKKNKRSGILKAKFILAVHNAAFYLTCIKLVTSEKKITIQTSEYQVILQHTVGGLTTANF